MKEYKSVMIPESGIGYINTDKWKDRVLMELNIVMNQYAQDGWVWSGSYLPVNDYGYLANVIITFERDIKE